MKTFSGGCYCGAIRFVIDGPPVWTAHCHCRSCQKALGGAFATWSKVAAKDFRTTKGSIKEIEKSTGVIRGFCEDCGTTLTYSARTEVDGQDWSDDAWFSTAALDDPSIAEPKSHVFASQKQPWITIADGLPTFEEF